MMEEDGAAGLRKLVGMGLWGGRDLFFQQTMTVI